jgi:hypothetical protein
MMDLRHDETPPVHSQSRLPKRRSKATFKPRPIQAATPPSGIEKIWASGQKFWVNFGFSLSWLAARPVFVAYFG